MDDKSKNLKELAESFLREEKDNPIARGDFVVWKKGLKNKRYPQYDEPVYVLEVLKEAIFDISDKYSGSAYFREPLDIVLAFVDPDGDFAAFHYDKRRFKRIQLS